MTLGYKIHQYGAYFFPRVILDGELTNANCGHHHKREDLAEKCAKKYLMPKWREIIAHHIETRIYLEGVGHTIYRLWYGAADGKMHWENFSKIAD